MRIAASTIPATSASSTITSAAIGTTSDSSGATHTTSGFTAISCSPAIPSSDGSSHSIRQAKIPPNTCPLPERFYGGGSSSQRGFPDNQAGPRDLVDRFRARRQRAPLPFHRTALSLPGRQHYRRALPRYGQRLFGPGQHLFPLQATRPHRLQLHGARRRFGVRYRTPVGPIRLDVAYSLNPPAFNGLKGTYQDLLINHGDSDSAARQPFSVLLLHRAGILI